MKTLRFEGHSDDTFGEYGVTHIDHDNCANGSPIVFEVSAEGKSILVTGKYDRWDIGTWDIGVSIVEEDNCPDWAMRIRFEGYTTVLEIDVPDDVTVNCWGSMRERGRVIE